MPVAPRPPCERRVGQSRRRRPVGTEALRGQGGLARRPEVERSSAPRRLSRAGRAAPSTLRPRPGQEFGRTRSLGGSLTAVAVEGGCRQKACVGRAVVSGAVAWLALSVPRGGVRFAVRADSADVLLSEGGDGPAPLVSVEGWFGGEGGRLWYVVVRRVAEGRYVVC